MCNPFISRLIRKDINKRKILKQEHTHEGENTPIKRLE